MLTIDRLDEADLPSALRLSTQAGWNQVDADWRRLLSLWPDTSLAGRVDGRLVATATLATYGDVGWVGMVLVDESHRRRGFGTEVLDAVLDLGRRRGVRRFGLDATELGRPVYLRRGFVDAVGIDRWLRPPAPPSSAGHATQDLRACHTLDLRSSGVDRRRLLARLKDEAGVRCFVAGEDAFAVLRPGRAADHIGPVVAADEARAEAVLAATLAAQGPARGAVIDVPRGRPAQFLPRHGFQPARRLVRMQTGGPTTHHPPLLAGPGVFAACGFELG